MRSKGSIAELEQTRMLAGKMFAEGLECKQIARILDRDAQTIRGWRRVYRKGGVKQLAGKTAPGASSKLTDQQKAQLIELLARPPREHELEGWLWTTKLIAGLIKKRFDVDYHHDHIGVILRELGLSWQRPMHRAKERNELEIAGWREQIWPALLKKVSTAEARSSSPTKSASCR
jgi:putative transposase